MTNCINKQNQESTAFYGNAAAAIFSRMAVNKEEKKTDDPVQDTQTEESQLRFKEESERYENIINEKTFEECYSKDKRLQNGTYGVVYEAIRLDDDTTDSKKYAVKVVDRLKLKKRDDTAVFREVSILKELSDVENVVSCIDFFVSPETLYVVLNLAQGGDVFDRLIQRKTYTEQFARELAKVLLKTIHIIHERKIIHRDLKPGNLLLRDDSDDCSILLADFGFATYLNEDGYCRTRCGTPAYVAPEVILECPYTSKVDCWSCGCILYMLLCGYPPFQGQHHRELFRKIRAGNFTFHESSWANVSIPAKQLIVNLLTVNPDRRWSAQEALESSWMKRSTPQHLSENDLSEALSRIRARRKLKAAMDAVRWATTAPFWNPDTITFSQQMKTWDRTLIQQQQGSINSIATASTATTTTSTDTPTKASLKSPSKIVGFQDRYTLIRKVQKGAYATVWECKHNTTSDIYAVKIIPRPCLSASHDELVLNEVSILQSVSAEAPHSIVSLVDFYEQEDAFYLVMELLAGGDVFDRIAQRTRYSELEARDLVKNLLEAVQTLHRKGIAHRDIKPQNLLLKVSRIRHADCETRQHPNANQLVLFLNSC
jgi:calcium/calmodulin-dependent protein kinase I